MQGGIGEQRADDTALRRAAVSVVEHPSLHVTGFQPLTNEFPCREFSNGIQQEFMVDIVERPLMMSASRTHFLRRTGAATL
jgi:hypothetical protein